MTFDLNLSVGTWISEPSPEPPQSEGTLYYVTTVATVGDEPSLYTVSVGFAGGTPHTEHERF